MVEVRRSSDAQSRSGAPPRIARILRHKKLVCTARVSARDACAKRSSWRLGFLNESRHSSTNPTKDLSCRPAPCSSTLPIATVVPSRAIIYQSTHTLSCICNVFQVGKPQERKIKERKIRRSASNQRNLPYGLAPSLPCTRLDVLGHARLRTPRECRSRSSIGWSILGIRRGPCQQTAGRCPKRRNKQQAEMQSHKTGSIRLRVPAASFRTAVFPSVPGTCQWLINEISNCLYESDTREAIAHGRCSTAMRCSRPITTQPRCRRISRVLHHILSWHHRLINRRSNRWPVCAGKHADWAFLGATWSRQSGRRTQGPGVCFDLGRRAAARRVVGCKREYALGALGDVRGGDHAWKSSTWFCEDLSLDIGEPKYQNGSSATNWQNNTGREHPDLDAKGWPPFLTRRFATCQALRSDIDTESTSHIA